MPDLPSLKQTYRRHSTPGSLMILLIAGIAFGPKLYDAARGEPWISDTLQVTETSAGQVIVEDVTHTNDAVFGLRVNTMENEAGEVLCSTEHHNTWQGERKRFWRLSAFSRCDPPKVLYRVCSRFSISSASGRTRQFGPFCSGFTKSTPVER